MDIATVARQRKSGVVVKADSVAAKPTDTTAQHDNRKTGLRDAVSKHMVRKKWLKDWDKYQDSKGAAASIVTSVVKQTAGTKNALWSSLIDVAMAAMPVPVPEGEQVVDCCPPFQGRSKITMDEFAAAIEAPTEECRWFTPRYGWPKSVNYAGGRPAELMPTEDMAEPGFFLPDGDALGELRVELLECDGLPSMDLGAWDENDVYALLVFEGTVARTRTIQDVDNPRWHCECARGFKLPIRSASSSLYLALFDSDEDAALNQLAGGLTRGLSNLKEGVEGISPRSPQSSSGAAGTSRSSKDLNGGAAGNGAAGSDKAEVGDDGNNVVVDDPIGRVVIEPRRLVPGTTYDSWFELRRSAALDDAGQFGAVRLRYSVVWASERRRLRAALAPPPAFVIPARRVREVTPKQLGAAVDFALRGEDSDDEHFSFQVFLAHVYEHKDAIKAAIHALIAAVESLVMYENVIASLLACSFWQAACSHPPLLASVPWLSLLWLLLNNRRVTRASQPAVQRENSIAELALAALLPGWWLRPAFVPPPGSAAPSQAALVARRAEEAAAAARKKAEIQEAAERLEKDLSVIRIRRPSKNLFSSWTPTRETSFVEVEEKAPEVDKAPPKRAATEAFTDPMMLLEPYLGWVQVMLGGYCRQLRAVRGVLCWHDPGLTLWLCAVLAAAALVAPLLPWLLLSRCFGALLLGPHMWMVGARRRRGAAAAAATAADAVLVYTASGRTYETGVVRAYSLAADPEERAAIVAETRKQREKASAEAAEAAEAAAAALPLSAFATLRRQVSAACIFEVHGSRTAQDKFIPSLPDPERSSAAALRK